MKRWRATPFAISSIAIHLLIGGAALRWYVLGYPMPDWLDRKLPATGTQQRITYVSTGGGRGPTARASNVTAGAAKRGKVAEPKQLVAPIVVPDGLPVAPTSAVVDDAGANGTEIGTGAGGTAAAGAIEGMRPALVDGRLYGPPPRGLGGPEPLNSKQRIDSVIGERFLRYRDSIVAVGMASAGQRQPGDWTYSDKNGRKWGVDQQYIRLGPVSIPTALLAMLPLNSNAPSPAMYESRRIANLSAEIQFNVSRAMTQEDFNAAVRRTRERKDRERGEAQRGRPGGGPGTQPGVQPSIAYPAATP